MIPVTTPENLARDKAAHTAANLRLAAAKDALFDAGYAAFVATESGRRPAPDALGDAYLASANALMDAAMTMLLADAVVGEPLVDHAAMLGIVPTADGGRDSSAFVKELEARMSARTSARRSAIEAALEPPPGERWTRRGLEKWQLALWSDEQREAHERGKMPFWQAAKLEALDTWTWED